MSALTPGFAASRDATGIPALSAMAWKVSPSWTLVVPAAIEDLLTSVIRSSKRAARTLLASEGPRILMWIGSEEEIDEMLKRWTPGNDKKVASQVA